MLLDEAGGNGFLELGASLCIVVGAMNENSSNELRGAIHFALALAQSIHAAGPDGIPSGHLYAAVMSKCDLAYYEGAIRLLVNQGVIRKDGHRLVSLV